ncbi:RNA-binding domain-containing protein [Psychrobacter sp. AOP22-C1-22]|uniref:RNA-binding domain-containing protein n=1 Tax=unclassified Psychrobacter TaxID=196806 RepID=UPI0017887CE1|nr:RNA-binding domain-containing protein [Psychrobacter sp. FME6]MBE0405906.1 putative DNA binding domain-containing protein [Psychrobacter sp. FME6]
MLNHYQSLVLSLTQQPTEQEWLEFKHNFHSPDEIGKRISALANGACLAGKKFGYLVFGVEDGTHNIVGTSFSPRTKKAKGNEDLEHWLISRISPKIHFTIHELQIDGKAVILFEIPAAIDTPISFLHEPYIRIGSVTKPLKHYPDQSRKLWQNQADDWSAEICHEAALEDLDPQAIAVARQVFADKNKRLAEDVKEWDDITFLNKAKITIHGQITHTAIILLGRYESTSFLSPAQAHITWILKGIDGIEKDYEHFEPPFLLVLDEVYNKIRNLNYRYMASGTLFPEEVQQYDPYIIREALSNAIGHQDYRLGGRIIVVEKEDSTLLFQNSGAFIPKTIENVLLQDAPEASYRNPFLVNAMVSLNMMDTIGSGIKKMYQIQSKRFFPLPDYDLTRERVGVKFTGKVLDQEYAKQLATVDNLTLHDIIALDKVQKGQVITENEADALRKKSLIEGRKNSYIIAADVAKHTEQQAEYMLLKGLNEKYYEAAVLDLLQQFGEASRSDFDKLLYNKLPEVLTDEQKFHKIKNLLQKMKKKKLIYFEDKVWKLV